MNNFTSKNCFKILGFQIITSPIRHAGHEEGKTKPRFVPTQGEGYA